MANIFSKIIDTLKGDKLKDAKIIADKVLALDKEYSKLTDKELQAKTNEFKERLEKGETLDDILVEAFATVREASSRTLNMKHFKVQIIGGVKLHQGKIAEMKTGEGKTLVATLPAYLNALTGKGVHVVTVNDYLAERDKNTMGKVYEFLGLSVSCIVSGMSNEEKRKAYAADITYGTNNEFGFDYLRDNMVIYKEEMVQREHNYAIIDEVDSILIDEARTPLIISGVGDKSTGLYKQADNFVKGLTGRIIDQSEKYNKDPFDREFKEETVDYTVDEKDKICTLTEQGIIAAEKYFKIENLADIENMELAHHINRALSANYVMKKDIDYVVQDGKVLIVDEFTGRIMDGRRYSEGLHQAIEAKENLKIESESKTLATITFQNYFRMYDKLSGMTGTAMTEEDEFREIYGMEVVEIPTNKPIQRIDETDAVYLNEEVKYKFIVDEIKRRHETGQPILVGTITIEHSEYLSMRLKQAGIKHQVLNAKHHMKEAEIIAQAGKLGAVTIATNMAGRGTDIILGGNPSFLALRDTSNKFGQETMNKFNAFGYENEEDVKEARKFYEEALKKYKKETDANAEKVKEVGGLFILGTERHESRRIDNQLRGRAGRQGDPGASKFFISLEDDLMRLFGGERITMFIETLNMDQDIELEYNILNTSIENAQKKVEGSHFSMRKNVLQYDDVINQQREIIYNERRRVLEGENMRPFIENMIEEMIDSGIETFLPGKNIDALEGWDIIGLSNYLLELNIIDETLEPNQIDNLSKDEVKDRLLKNALIRYDNKEVELGDKVREIERIILLQAVDSRWMDHIDAMDQLRQGIGLRAYGQTDPVQAYQFEGFDMFEEMNHSIKEIVVKSIYAIEPVDDIQRKRVAKETNAIGGELDLSKKPAVKENKVGRNDPCPCGSGKKYKKCCGAN